MAFKSSQNHVGPHILYTIGSGACLVVSGGIRSMSGGVWWNLMSVWWCPVVSMYIYRQIWPELIDVDGQISLPVHVTDAAKMLMLLMRQCCWCTDAADAMFLLMQCCSWCCWCADAAASLMLLNVLLLQMCWCCWCNVSADAMLQLMLLMCWCSCFADATECAVAANVLMLLMHWCCWCADALMLQMQCCCWCTVAADAVDALMRWSPESPDSTKSPDSRGSTDSPESLRSPKSTNWPESPDSPNSLQLKRVECITDLLGIFDWKGDHPRSSNKTSIHHRAPEYEECKNQSNEFNNVSQQGPNRLQQELHWNFWCNQPRQKYLSRFPFFFT